MDCILPLSFTRIALICLIFKAFGWNIQTLFREIYHCQYIKNSKEKYNSNKKI